MNASDDCCIVPSVPVPHRPMLTAYAGGLLQSTCQPEEPFPWFARSSWCTIAVRSHSSREALMPTPQYGSDLVVDLMQRFGIEYASLNPGSTFRGLHDSIVNYGKNHPQIITCQHEEVAVQIAHGYARVTGKPMVAIVHDVVGLLHASMAVYYAHLDRVPVIVMGGTGPMDTARRRPHIDWTHTALVQGNIVRDYVRWDDQAYSVDAVPDSFARGYRMSLTHPQGPVYLCWDAALQEDPLDHAVPLVDPERARPPAPLMGHPEALRTAADILVAADMPVILTEYTGRTRAGYDALVALAEALGAAVVDLHGRQNFPNTHPLAVSETDVIRRADAVLALDLSDLHGPLSELDRVTRRTAPITPPGCKIIDIGFRDLRASGWSQEFQKFTEVDLFLHADTSTTLPALTKLVQDRVLGDNARAQRVSARAADLRRLHDAARDRWADEAMRDWNASPVSVPRLAMEIRDALQGEDWVLCANALRDSAHRYWDMSQWGQHTGNELGTSTQIGMNLGIALALRNSGKLVIAVQPDGDLMFDVGALWIAAHDRIPLLLVMFNNRAYYNDWEHQIRMAEVRERDVRMAYIGQEIDNPPPDFATVARGFGWYGEGPIDQPKDIRPAIQRGIERVKAGQPALIDVVTQPR
ncbi:MAG: thiamine pyrophosphate-binding protein [Chloroflexi bacterium]|nr:thiamine pyrophosphate-binding protein [Chloroflexota bacterium]